MAADLQKFLFKSKFLRKDTVSRTITVVLVTLGYILVCTKGQECQVECQHGRCVENKCICDSGWEGNSCQFCGGRVRLWSSNSSVITDGSGNYSEDNQCAWLIDATRPNANIRLHLDHFATECSWDHLYVFDGNSIYDPLLAVFSGMVVQDDYSVPYIPEVVAKSGFALLYFYSDAAYNLTGFSISYKVEGCASTVVGSECSKHGVCLDGVCTCDAGWGGAACSIETCPRKCSGHGQCHPEEHRCVCHQGFTGADCSQMKEEGWWEVVGHDVSSQIQEASPASYLLERSSHTALLLTDKIWVIGGHSFTKKSFLLEYDIQDDKWTSVEKSSIKEPTPRYGHSAITYNGSIYIFGGMKEDGSISNELWRMEPSTRQWSLVLPEPHGAHTLGKSHSQTLHTPSTDTNRGKRDSTEGPNTHNIHNNISTRDYENQSEDLASDEDFNDEVSSSNNNGGVCSSTLSGPCAPIAVVGHTCVVVQKGQKQIMLVIFGHSEKYGYLSTIQEYQFETSTWTTAPSRGAVVNGVYGHTAVWDPSTSLVYLHGGLKSEGSNNHVVPHLITYNPNTYIWTLRRPAPVPRFLHSSVLVGGLMLVFGGNTHNDTAYSYGAKCYSADFIAYDITCDRWHTLTNLPRLYLDVARYGHSATVYQDSIYVIGGFNGKMLGSVLKYTLGDCKSRPSKECLGSYPGRKCVWNRILKRCEAWSNNDNTPYDECHAIADKTNLTALCEQQSSCQSCVHNTYQCFWCGQECSHNKCSEYTKGVVSGDSCDDGLLVRCKNLHRCPLCRAHAHCDWQNDHCLAAPNRTSLSVLESDPVGSGISEDNNELREGGQSSSDFHPQGIKPSSGTQTHSSHKPCSLTCNERTSCSNCTESHCMWCFNQQRCVSNNSYLVSFPYGQCREWTTEKNKCMNIHKGMSRCSVHETCHECQEDVACGWCDDGSGTGIGRCMEGGQRGPVNSHTGVTMASHCPSTLWFFTECPLCNCNGHSHCHSGSSECIMPCANNTEGTQCQHCIETFFGKSINGGLCEACSCNNHGETCNRETGRCNCHTKGVAGDHCERCDTQNNYRGEPLHGSCFYDLQIDYQFTFNLSKHEDRHIRQINFFNTPTKSDVDTDFDISCSKPAKIKISAKTTGSHEAWIVSNYTGKRIKRRFSASEYRFGSQENNTTFHVYVYNFTPPIEIIVSFSQHPKLDLIQFFSIFSLCFLILLILAAILWKIKQKYDLYTRRQRLLVEMEAMASRPFRPILLELNIGKCEVGNNFCTKEGTNGTIISNTNSPDSLLPDLYDSHSFRKRKKENPSPIALEPCCGNRAAVLSLLIQLPTGGDRYVPQGHPGGLAIASTLVTLGTPRKCSADPITIKGDINKNKTRGKQQYTNQSPDTCI